MFANNQYTGLTIYSGGVITTTNITASFNGLALDVSDGAGVYLDNCNKDTVTTLTCVVNKPVTLNGTNTFNGNNLDGLDVVSFGAITAKQVTANGNGGDGALLNNVTWTLLTPAAVTLTGINTFNDNGSGVTGSGLVVLSDGTITIANLTANNNHEYGAYLDNQMYSGPARNIILTGANTFVNNVKDGLYFHAMGAVTLTQVTADLNGSNGVYGMAGGTIMFNCGSLYQNVHTGFHLDGLTITLKGVYTGMNPDGNSFNIPPVVTRACPIP